MAFEIDHLFICTAAGAPAAEKLIQFGLTEGSANVHPGQGTANRRFFFHNMMLELLWVHSAAEAQAATTQPTYLWERWAAQQPQTCPFGVCLRPSGHPAPDALPFSTWDYRPAYLPEGLAIPVATNASVLSEPMLFYLPFAQRQDKYTGAKAEPLNHAIALQAVTGVSLTLPLSAPPSTPLQAVAEAGLITIQPGQRYLIEIDFDQNSKGQHHDFRPALPLVFRW
ncbi:VOC family protein [Nodosilinea sp. AN01ver1]|uniref:VOC family protein n=1 Tax=Nodosilinea sp. AN01ver1 TaxID=3423362 RepID=UPI003D319862